MEPNAEFRNLKSKMEGNRKRSASGRLSPRSLFGNLQAKRSFQDEDAVSRNLNNSKNTNTWKPPLKVDSNESSNKCSVYDCDMETLSFPNNETILSQNHNFIVNEPHYSQNENVYCTDNGPDFHEEPCNGNSIETTQSREFSYQNNLMNNQDVDYSEENISHELNNYIVNAVDNLKTVIKEGTDGVQVDCRQDRNHFRPLTEKIDFSGNNHEYLNRSFQESNILQRPSPSRNEINFENENYDANNNLSQNTVKLERDSHGEYVDMRTPIDEDQEYSEKSDSSKSTLELSDSKKFSIRPDDIENKNILPQEINHGNFHGDVDKNTREFCATRRVDDSFDTGVTNSQFLQLENQISKSSIEKNMKNQDVIPLINDIEMMKRYCGSLATQTEWQRNVLKSITRDIDDLNKAIINVTGVLKSIRKNNGSAK